MIWHHCSVLSSANMRTTSLGFLCKIPDQKRTGVEKYSTVSLQKGTGGVVTEAVPVHYILPSGVERKTEFKTKSKYCKPLMS